TRILVYHPCEIPHQLQKRARHCGLRSAISFSCLLRFCVKQIMTEDMMMRSRVRHGMTVGIYANPHQVGNNNGEDTGSPPQVQNDSSLHSQTIIIMISTYRKCVL